MQDNLTSYSLVLLKAGLQSNHTSSYVTSSTTISLNCSTARQLPHIPQLQNIDPISTCTQSFATEQVSELLPCTYITLITSKCLLGSSDLQCVVQASMHTSNCQKPVNHVFMQDCRYYKNSKSK